MEIITIVVLVIGEHVCGVLSLMRINNLAKVNTLVRVNIMVILDILVHIDDFCDCERIS